MSAPCDVTLTGEGIRLTPRGWHRFLALTRGFDVPFSSIVRVQIGPSDVKDEMGWFGPMAFRAGSRIGKLYRAGTYRPLKKTDNRRITSWWLVRHPEQALLLELVSFKYDRIVVEVDDPHKIAVLIRANTGEGNVD
ncbi:MAG: hypothetical protein WKF81_13785 [Thermomicrobiales bacterium]